MWGWVEVRGNSVVRFPLLRYAWKEGVGVFQIGRFEGRLMEIGWVLRWVYCHAICQVSS